LHSSVAFNLLKIVWLEKHQVNGDELFLFHFLPVSSFFCGLVWESNLELAPIYT